MAAALDTFSAALHDLVGTLGRLEENFRLAGRKTSLPALPSDATTTVPPVEKRTGKQSVEDITRNEQVCLVYALSINAILIFSSQ
jgi:hypothetical protein